MNAACTTALRAVSDLPILGYRSNGDPIRLIAGGSGEGDDSGAGSGSAGEGSGSEDGEGEGGARSGKDLADMSDAEKAEFWKRQARTNERKLKAAPRSEELQKLRDAAAELEKIRDSQRSDQEKAVARAEKAETELNELRPRLLRLEVAIDKGLPARLATRLVGSTKEELEADADALLEEFGSAIKADADKGAAREKERRSAARKGTASDAGVRGTRQDTKPSVASGAELFAAKKAKKTTAATSAASA